MTPLEMTVKLWGDRIAHLEHVTMGSHKPDDTILDAANPLCKAYGCAKCPVCKHLGKPACEGSPEWSYDFCIYKRDYVVALDYARQTERMLKLCKEP